MKRHTAIAAPLAALLAACGGSSSGSGDPSPAPAAGQVTRGAITSASPGSLVVNGITFTTSAGTRVRIEKAERPESELRHGMTVRVVGNHQDRRGQALEIEFEDQVKGRVRSRGSTPSSTTLDVGGRTVHVEDSTRVTDDRGADVAPGDVGPDDRVRVSGYADDQGRFRATSVERQARASGDDSFESKGWVHALNPGRTAFTLVPRPGATAGIAVALGSGVTLAPAIVEGSLVEVRAPGSLAGNAVTASSVQLEDDREDGGVELEVEGIVTSGSAADFVVAGQRVTTSASTRWEFGTAADFAPGVKVEAEGHVVDASGSLLAEKVSFRHSVRIEAPLAVSGADLSALGLPIVDGELTLVEDAIVDGGTYEIRGYPRRDGSGGVVAVVATRIRARSSGGGSPRYLWQGPVDAIGGTSTLSILGVTVTTAGAEFQDHKQSDSAADVVIGRDAFFARLVAGASVVKARLVAAPSGTPLAAPADELELQDEPSPHK